MIVIHICKASKEYRMLSKENNFVRKAYAKARLNHLELKCKPYVIERTNLNGISPFHFREFTNEQRYDLISTGNSINQSLISIQSVAYRNCYHLKSFSMLIIMVFISLIIAGIHSFIPSIYRSHAKNESTDSASSIIDIHWQISCIRVSYIVFSFVYYTILVFMMMISIASYWSVYSNLKKLLHSTDLMQTIDSETQYFLRLREPLHLEYFLSLFRPLKRAIDPYHMFLSTMGCALIMNFLLIATTVIYVFIYERPTELLTIWCLIDIIILSFFILIFLGIVVFINKLLTHDLIRHLKELKKSMMTPASLRQNPNEDIPYLDVVIGHMESEREEYAVKLLGLLIDHKLVFKILISVATGIGSSLVSFLKSQ